jgi:hypothetical protein
MGIGQVGPYSFGSPARGFDLVDDRTRPGSVAALMNENPRTSLGECQGGGAPDAA